MPKKGFEQSKFEQSKKDLKQSLETNEARIKEAESKIEYEINIFKVPKGEVYFFDGNDKKTGKGDCNEQLKIPEGTKKIIANGNVNMKGAKGFKYLSVYAAGNVTGQELDLGEYLAVRATGNVDLINKSGTIISVTNNGDVKLGGFTYASVNSRGSVLSTKRSMSFQEITTQGDISIFNLAKDNKVNAGGNVRITENYGTVNAGGNVTVIKNDSGNINQNLLTSHTKSLPSFSGREDNRSASRNISDGLGM